MGSKDVRAYDFFGKAIYDGDYIIIPDTTNNFNSIPFLRFGIVQIDKMYYMDEKTRQIRFIWLSSKNKLKSHNILKTNAIEMDLQALNIGEYIKLELAKKNKGHDNDKH